MWVHGWVTNIQKVFVCLWFFSVWGSALDVFRAPFFPSNSAVGTLPIRDWGPVGVSENVEWIDATDAGRLPRCKLFFRRWSLMIVWESTVPVETVFKYSTGVFSNILYLK